MVDLMVAGKVDC
jgi:hypothetical protein